MIELYTCMSDLLLATKSTEVQEAQYSSQYSPPSHTSTRRVRNHQKKHKLSQPQEAQESEAKKKHSSTSSV